MRGGTTENQVMSDGSPRGDFYRRQLLFSFKKRNKQSAYGTGAAGNKVKCDAGHALRDDFKTKSPKISFDKKVLNGK